MREYRGLKHVGGLAADAAGCCVHDDGPDYPPGGSSCTRPVAWAGAVSFRYPKPYTCRAFACDHHKPVLDNPQPYGSNPEHSAEMQRRLAANGGPIPTPEHRRAQRAAAYPQSTQRPAAVNPPIK